MPNLSGERGRVLAQSRITNNRDAVLPTRRNTDAPAVAIRADMRAASRGDGGADNLKRTLDGWVNAFGQAAEAKTLNDQPRFRREATEGALDAQSGEAPNPERAASSPYVEAFYEQRTLSQFNAFSAETQGLVDDALAKGDGPDEVEALVMGRTQEFLDTHIAPLPEGVERARQGTVTRLGEMARTFDTTIATRIRERTQQEFVTTTQGNIRTALAADQPLAFETYVQTFRDGGFAPAEAKQNAVDAIMAAALDRDHPRPELLDQLLDSTQADGKTPSLSAREQVLVQDRLSQSRQLRDQNDREAHEAARDDLTETLFKDALAGTPVEDRIKAAALDGTYTPQEASSALGLIAGFHNALGEGFANEDFVLEVTRRSALGNPPSNAEVFAWERDGRFGSGRAAQRAAIQFLQDNASARRAAAGSRRGASANGSFLSAAEEGNRNISTARSMLWDETQPEGDERSRYQREMLVLQDREFNSRVRGGEDPLNVSRDLITRNRDLIQGNRRSQGGRAPASQPITQVRRGPDGRLVVN